MRYSQRFYFPPPPLYANRAWWRLAVPLTGLEYERLSEPLMTDKGIRAYLASAAAVFSIIFEAVGLRRFVSALAQRRFDGSSARS